MSGGTLSGNTQSIGPSAVSIGSGANLEFNQALAGTFANNITGSGSLTKTGSEQLTLTGANTYSGGTTVSGGTLSGNTQSIGPAAVSIGSGADLEFNQTSAGTFAYDITGSGSFIKEGNGNLNLTGNGPDFDGSFQLNEGALGLNGNFRNADLKVVSGSLIYGTGTIRSMDNGGSLYPGNSIGTITVDGNFSQTESGILDIEIAPNGTCDKVVITGEASLNGTVNITALTSGFYEGGTTYTFMTYDSIKGDFATKNSSNPFFPDFFVRGDNSYSVTLASGIFIPPIPTDILTGNNYEIASALFCDQVTSTGDLSAIKVGLVNLSPQDYLNALYAIAPDELSGLTIMEMENQNRIIDLLTNRSNRLSDRYCQGLNSLSTNTIFVNPIAFWLNQKSNNTAFGFRGNTGGLGIGYERQFYKNNFLGLGGAYTNGVYRFLNQQGKMTQNSFYLAPYFSTKKENFYLTVGVMGSYDAVEFARYIVYPGVNRTAYSSPSTWNISEQIQSKYHFNLTKNKYFEPFVQATFSQIIRQSTTENGAASLDYFYNSQTNATVRAIFKGTYGILKCFTRDISLDSRGTIGYVYNSLMTSNNYSADFLVPNQVCFSNLEMQGIYPSRNQLLAEVNFVARFKEKAKASVDLSYQWGDMTNVAALVFNLEYEF